MPNKLLICPLAMVMAAAVVKPVVTGTDINRTKTPRFKIPKRSIRQPDRKQDRTA